MAGSDAVQRDAWLDNIKGILVISVVVGHMMTSLVKYSGTAEVLYKLINAVHMACFMILTGYLSKGRIGRRDYKKMITRLAIPYFVAQILVWGFCCLYPNASKLLVGQTPGQLIWLMPCYHLWYLFAILVFNLITPYLSRLFCRRPWLLLGIAFVASLLVGYSQEILYMRVTKNIGYYFFFLTGYYLKKEWLYALRDKWKWKVCGFFVVICWLVLQIRYSDHIYIKIFSLATPYKRYPEPFNGYYPLVSRGIFLLAAIVVSFSLMSLVTKRRTIFTRAGEYSLYIYILHGFLVLAVRTTGIYPLLNTPVRKGLFLIGSAAISYVFCSPLAIRIFRPLFEPQIDWKKIKNIIG